MMTTQPAQLCCVLPITIKADKAQIKLHGRALYFHHNLADTRPD